MTFPGKNYPGQKGFPTPNSTPSETRRRIFVVPADAEWLGLIMGAAEVLREEWRWYQWGALTPAEAAAAFNTIIIDAFENVCPPVLPGGGRVIRLNPLTGVVEEGADDGTWQPPTGDYAFPAIPARETDAICLAAANAANVLQLLYENITDSAGALLTLEEAIAAFIVACLEVIGVAAAAAAGALIAIVGAIFAVVYFTASFLLSDLWDVNFTAQLVCLLVECATDTDGVVTFGWDCFWESLANQTNAFDLTSDQIRLYAQIMFILQVIGGADGLNAAGATTAITDYDCSDCNDVHCFTIDFEATDGSEFGVTQLFAGGVWVDGVGWQTTLDGVDQDVTLGWAFPSTLTVVAMSAITYRPAASGADSGVNLNLKYPGAAYADPTVQHADNLDNTDLPPFTFQTGATFAGTLGDGLTVDNNSGNSDDVVVTKRISVRYTGDEVFGGDNC